jgi:hypothetical protein
MGHLDNMSLVIIVVLQVWKTTHQKNFNEESLKNKNSKW